MGTHHPRIYPLVGMWRRGTGLWGGKRREGLPLAHYLQQPVNRPKFTDGSGGRRPLLRITLLWGLRDGGLSGSQEGGSDQEEWGRHDFTIEPWRWWCRTGRLLWFLTEFFFQSFDFYGDCPLVNRGLNYAAFYIDLPSGGAYLISELWFAIWKEVSISFMKAR